MDVIDFEEGKPDLRGNFWSILREQCNDSNDHGQDKIRRMENFTDMELNVLLNEVEANKLILLSGVNGREGKTAVWESIAAKLKETSGTVRTPRKCFKKWSDLRYTVQQCVAHENGLLAKKPANKLKRSIHDKVVQILGDKLRISKDLTITVNDSWAKPVNSQDISETNAKKEMNSSDASDEQDDSTDPSQTQTTANTTTEQPYRIEPFSNAVPVLAHILKNSSVNHNSQSKTISRTESHGRLSAQPISSSNSLSSSPGILVVTPTLMSQPKVRIQPKTTFSGKLLTTSSVQPVTTPDSQTLPTPSPAIGFMKTKSAEPTTQGSDLKTTNSDTSINGFSTTQQPGETLSSQPVSSQPMTPSGSSQCMTSQPSTSHDPQPGTLQTQPTCSLWSSLKTSQPQKGKRKRALEDHPFEDDKLFHRYLTAAIDFYTSSKRKLDLECEVLNLKKRKLKRDLNLP